MRISWRYHIVSCLVEQVRYINVLLGSMTEVLGRFNLCRYHSMTTSHCNSSLRQPPARRVQMHSLHQQDQIPSNCVRILEAMLSRTGNIPLHVSSSSRVVKLSSACVRILEATLSQLEADILYSPVCRLSGRDGGLELYRQRTAHVATKT